MTNGDEVRASTIVRFPIELTLPEPNDDYTSNAAQAAKSEYRDSVKWKRLRCRRVTPILQREDEAIFAVEVGQAIEFDWTWEGAVAFRPSSIDQFNGSADTIDDFLPAVDGDGGPGEWSGEVVEVDEANGRVFVWVSDPQCPPTTGSFFVRPFEFLAFLHAIYCDPALACLQEMLPARLNAARGNVHPEVARPVNEGLSQLRRTWDHA